MATTRRVTLAERLARDSTLIEGGDCIEWTASLRPDGYGQVRWEGRARAVHRLAWIAAHGAIPPGMGVLHKCDNPACLNVAHLFLGTQSENMADKVAKGRQCKGAKRAEIMRRVWGARSSERRAEIARKSVLGRAK
jgi:hypothetical protein